VGFAGAHPTRADFLVSIEGRSLPEGQSGVVDVFLESTNPGGDPLNFFQVAFHVGRQSGSGRLDFGTPELTGLVDDSTYVFHGLGSPFGSVETGSQPDDTFHAGDGLPDMSNVTVGFGPSGRRLLARLALTPGSGILAPTAGSAFAIALAPGAGTGTLSDATSFYVHDGTTDEDRPVSFTSSSGRISITTIPEPGSLALAVLGMSALLAGSVARRVRGGRDRCGLA
jgi:hypothetical protein